MTAHLKTQHVSASVQNWLHPISNYSIMARTLIKSTTIDVAELLFSTKLKTKQCKRSVYT